jgi:hypothetical protein
MTPDDFRIFCAVFGVAFLAIVVYRRLRRSP